MEPKKTYSEQLKDPRWQKKRLEILSRDNFTCQKCGDEKTTLHIHHKSYVSGKKAWEYESDYLITLCSLCHKEIEEIIKRDKNININNIKIFKSFFEKSGSNVLFIRYPNNFEISVYNSENEMICGYCFDPVVDIPKIKTLLNNF